MSGAANSSSSYNFDFPKKSDEKEKCEDFLRNFVVSGSTFHKYVEQMQEISNRQRKVLEIYIDDLLDHRGDQEFVNNVISNTLRYVNYFQEATDGLLPAANVERRERDTFDILQV